MESTNFILPFVAILAIATLVCPRPSVSSTLLFLQSILINLVIFQETKQISLLGTSILLSFFTMVTIGANYYLELSFKNNKIKPSKFSLIAGFFLLLFFWQNIDNFIPPTFIANDSKIDIGFMELLILGFTLFSILVSAITVLSVKNSRRGKV